MKYIDEYRNIEHVQVLQSQIKANVEDRDYTFMEVCGTHTMSIAKYSIRKLLPKNVRLISGPGCPVCVTPNNYVDHAVALSKLQNVIITTFGDMIKVPGGASSLEKERACSGNIEIVYSPLDALELAKKNPDKEIVFLSVGFETTIPGIAATVKTAKEQNILNFSILTANKTVPKALEALVLGKTNLDGFILPGHVSAIIGANAYTSIVKDHKVACAIAGFEPVDILQSILDLIIQVNEETPLISNKYQRAVTESGNVKAMKIMTSIFEPCNAYWRGIGEIPDTGLYLRAEYSGFDAACKFDVTVENTVENKGCICGQILQGIKTPDECPLFGKKCTPVNPVGACMVSSEGTCAAWYKYEK